MKYNIYEEQMDGRGCFETTIDGNSKAEALAKFYKDNEIEKEYERLYYAIEKEKDDENKRLLKESGHSTWDEYFEDMYPTRPSYI